MYFLLFLYFLPFEKGMAHYLNKFEGQDFLNISQKSYLTCEINSIHRQTIEYSLCISLIFLILLLYHLRKGCGLSFELTWISITQAFFFLPNMFEIWPVVQEKMKSEKLTDRQIDDGRQAIRKSHLSFQIRWAQNELLTGNKKNSLKLSDQVSSKWIVDRQ